MDTALIAVVGTLLGVIATHWFQSRAATRQALDRSIVVAAPGVR